MLARNNLVSPIPSAPHPVTGKASPFMDYVVCYSHLIDTPEEARDYYREKLARAHAITSHGRPISIVFERDATHLYSIEVPDPSAIPVDERITRAIGGGRVDVRRFKVERARLMDHVLPAVSLFTVSIPGDGRRGQEKAMLHGPRLATGDYMRVVLRPGPGTAWTCVSAYPVNTEAWLAARRAKSAKFPP